MKPLIVLAVILLSGCANPYAQFYKGMPDARVRPGYIASSDELKIYSTNDFKRDARALMQRGYVAIGESSFNAGTGSATEALLREHAQKIGAHVALIASKFTHSVSGAMPLTVPTTTTSYSTGTATAYGRGGPITAYGSGTTTTYGTQTTYIPYTIDRADFNAVYFVKAKTRIGFYAEPLTDDDRRRLQRNSGVRIGVVVDGTPAFDSDVLPGDVLISFDGQTVRSVEHYQDLLLNYRGESVDLLLDRDGRAITKTVSVRSL